MEDRNEREIKLDSLKSFTSEALFCNVATIDRSDRPWRTLVHALHQAMPESCITEEEVRRYVIKTYWEELSHDTSQVLEAKLNDELSYFKRAGYVSVDTVKDHFAWYLCCLSYDEDQFETESQSRSSPPSDMIRMPLDKVDLQIVASAFQTDIIVYHLLERPWAFSASSGHRLGYSGHCVRLLRYEDLWAAMGTPRAPEDDLIGAVVELVPDLPGLLQPASRRAATILGHEVRLDAYIACINDAQFLLQRHQINRVIFQDGIYCDTFSQDEGPEFWGHIPAKSIFFDVLVQLVIKLAKPRLEACQRAVKGNLASGNILKSARTHLPGQSRPAIVEMSCNETKVTGRGCHPSLPKTVSTSRNSCPDGKIAAQILDENAPSASKYETSSVVPASNTCMSSSTPCAVSQIALMPSNPGPANWQASKVRSAPTRSLPLAVAREILSAGRQLTLMVVQNFDSSSHYYWSRRHGQAPQLEFKALDPVVIVEFRSHWAKCKLTRRQVSAAWCPIICLTLWRVHTAFMPDLSHNGQRNDQCLPLESGQDVLVYKLWEKGGSLWGKGRLYNTTESSLTSREGIFPMESLSSWVFISEAVARQNSIDTR